MLPSKVTKICFSRWSTNERSILNGSCLPPAEVKACWAPGVALPLIGGNIPCYRLVRFQSIGLPGSAWFGVIYLNSMRSMASKVWTGPPRGVRSLVLMQNLADSLKCREFPFSLPYSLSDFLLFVLPIAPKRWQSHRMCQTISAGTIVPCCLSCWESGRHRIFSLTTPPHAPPVSERQSS